MSVFDITSLKTGTRVLPPWHPVRVAIEAQPDEVGPEAYIALTRVVLSLLHASSDGPGRTEGRTAAARTARGLEAADGDGQPRES